MIVEFLEGRDFMNGWVLNTATHRLTVLGQAGREMTVSQSRILSSQTPGQDPGNKAGRLEALRELDAKRRALAQAVHLEEMWEVLEGEGNNFPFAVLASLFYGHSPSSDEISSIYRAVFADGLLFKFTPEGAIRHNQEEVEKVTRERKRAAEEEKLLENAAGWISLAIKGSVAPEPEHGAGLIRACLIDFALWNDDSKQKQLAKKILSRASINPEAEGAIKVLKALGEFTPHENLDLRRLDLPSEFSAEALEETQLIAGGNKRFEGEERLDLTALKTITIDSNGAKDLDDAISVKSLGGGRWQLCIHIADAAAFIAPDSFLDQAAIARASSIYLPEAKYPMLPPDLSEGQLSLTPGDVKPAFSFVATVEEDGSIAEYFMSPSLIRVDRQYSFAEADSLLEEDSDLVDLWDLAQALVAKRGAAGAAITLNLPKLNVYFGQDGNINLGLNYWDTPAKTIVGEIMILANHLAADILHKNNFPCPFRFQEKGQTLPPPEQEAGEDAFLTYALASKRHSGRSGISFKAAPHHGLGLDVYTAFTAPMRRYVDLLVTRQLRSLAANKEPAMDEQHFMRLAIPAHELQQKIQKMQNRRLRYWLLTALADKTGHEYSALVFEQNKRRLRICLTDFMLETELFLPRDCGDNPPTLLGKRINVKLAAVNPQNNSFRLEPRL